MVGNPSDSASTSASTRRDHAYCVLWATGPDTTIDGVFRISALRRTAAGWAAFDRFCNPFPRDADEHGVDADAGATARMVREFGVDRRDLEGQPDARELWPELLDFVTGTTVLVPDGATFEAWAAALSGSVDDLPQSVGLAETALLLVPGRLGNRREGLVRDLAPPPEAGARSADARGSSGGPSPLAVTPHDLSAAFTELVGRFLENDDAVLALFAAGVRRAEEGLVTTDPRAARHLRQVWSLVDRPSAWHVTDDALPFRAAPDDGQLDAVAGTDLSMEQIVEEVQPRCATAARRWLDLEPLSPDGEAEKPFPAEDRRRLDDVFAAHLPALFAADTGEPAHVRGSQHEVARAVADALDRRELLLVHAPTGTGKTLAYLVPALLWAHRHDVRVGIATYTRALQEQAMDREVPRALAALARAGIRSGLRVSVLKGRENYLCWRALRAAVPSDDDDGEAWLAWTLLALFAATDPDGDLDRLPQRPPTAAVSTAAYRRVLGALLRQVRAESGCCVHDADRETCAAETARRRAERSHVVITNQAFALLRPEFFKHLVFDECEHLHDVAHSVFSRTTSLRRIAGVLDRLHQPGRPSSRAPLDRLQRGLLAGAPVLDSVDTTIARWEETRHALDALARAVAGFESWRNRAARERSDRDAHSLLREYCLEHDADELLSARLAFFRAGSELESALSALAEHLEDRAVSMRGIPRLRRTLERLRVDLEEILGVVSWWIPLQDGRARFPTESFHDVERNARDDTILAARVLLPNEFLGRQVYPELGTGVLVSATTYLKQSFDPALRYLGLDRTQEPAEIEQRAPREVRTFRAPEVFDYRRVLVAVPRDAPDVRRKDEFLDYVRRFLGHLGERTRGRILALFTNADDVRAVGHGLEGFFRARRIPFWFQNMEGRAKEELGELFRSRVDSVLLGVDTFWFGADFPGETLEYLVIVRLPYGVPDRYHHAQSAALGAGRQRETIYLPRALAKLRQGFGRLMRRRSDKGCVFVLDQRILDPRHRAFLKELPLQSATFDGSGDVDLGGARLVRGETDRCVHEALAHMDMLADVRRRGLEASFTGNTLPILGEADTEGPSPERTITPPRRRPAPEVVDMPVEDLPF